MDDGLEVVGEKVAAEESGKTSAVPDNNREFQQILPYFKIDKPDDRQAQELGALWEHLKEVTDVTNESGLISALIDIEERLGAPRVGETRLGNIYGYVKASKAVREDEKMRDSLLRR